MGNEHSASSDIRSQRDDEYKHSSLSLQRPIGADSTKPPSKLSSRSKSVPAPSGSIVVVADGLRRSETDAELKMLNQTPVFVPLIESASLPRIDKSSLLKMAARYEEHLKTCSEAIVFDQNVLYTRIRDIDSLAQNVYMSMTERQRKYAKYAEQLQRISDTRSTLTKIRMNMTKTVHLMKELNDRLPDDEKLEEFHVNIIDESSTPAE
ncbi:DgyrCDS6281 [Dimorphilus gyrociliatus]|uniref:BLOC-1-related complex subunit 5 n=1 Tax=Dimorphilus gyrociliatus TaxID=2664684 RepID=A0A7I8VP82_9ANNE|nr:DgyrCDS6281 [Dimorphilus gyrociliatus]